MSGGGDSPYRVDEHGNPSDGLDLVVLSRIALNRNIGLEPRTLVNEVAVILIGELVAREGFESR